MIFKKIINKFYLSFSSIYYRFRYKALFLSDSLRIVKSKVSISDSSCFRGSLNLNNTFCKIADKVAVNKTAQIDFSGVSSKFIVGSNVNIGPFADIGGGLLKLETLLHLLVILYAKVMYQSGKTH